MSTFLRRLVAVVPVTALLVGGATLVHADPASAFGDNRAVARACGQNDVSSSGAIQWTTSSAVRGTAKHQATSLGDTTGRHKGCPSCAVTLS
ncbi:hypothetical protein [Cellulomonas triticagri]|uniref:Uncharacterized protein n=1 Tax=Cellulomonas triticagri TaxID=2483352 RepID=A0A3M2JKJ8_9CELL|nr:hypothetical protein [Cellulomonas triticagri]RMI12736.1 hypothetical protein EBM89_07280 [Cellulomonas triticagri]